MPFDSTGKISFDHIYTAPDPRPFFGTLRRVGYEIPQLAKPYFAKLIGEHPAERPTVLDVGCSYGVNAALRRCDATMDDLYAHYTDPDVRPLSHARLLEADRTRVTGEGGAKFYGLDASAPALEYALSAGFLDEAIHADLEHDDPDSTQRKLLDDVDLVISTGCVGYVTEKTITRIARGSRPWMAHFVLRMFSYEPVADSLAGLGYETAQVPGVFRQRRFASAEEQTQILDTLDAAGFDPAGLESDGWLYAQLYVSRPEGAAAELAATLATSQQEG
ncbi:class I SAM-dependent methyltransferase [Amycolatopsis sp. NBC_01488]|uniref:class I SAM-dependent methyltransferase n=1 Tax=Amycolatopsis sp. NBC_01488 TaxID=2903563 RepID=UPI002E28454B|nr:class I SAM-dependent methyltransferase [Amycolatopsis sp. NBC_01488]